MEITPEVAVGYADQKKEIGEGLVEMRETAADLEKSIKVRELTVMAQIADEVDGAGKAVFSNAEKRSAELERRLSASEGHQAEINALRQARRLIQLGEVDLKYQSDLLTICLAFAESK